MATFVPRLTAPSETGPYKNTPFSTYNLNMFGNSSGKGNCTHYAWSRFYEITGKYPNLSTSNAKDWYWHSDGYGRGQTPKLGAVMCWTSSKYGHVAIVEQIKPNGDVIFSESWYGGKFFGTDVATKSSGYFFSSGYSFQGFIYCGIEFNTTTTTNGSTVAATNQTTANQILNPATRNMTTSVDSKLIWQFLILKIQNPYGVAGLMGNLYHESALSAINLQGSYEDYLGYNDTSYTQAVDNGSYSAARFIDDEAGYGLAQWTYWSRKEKLYNYCKSKKASIGNVITQLEFLYNELSSSYPSVLNTLKRATSVQEASNSVLFYYESPADQSSSVQQKRATTGQNYYNQYKSITATSLGTTTTTDTTTQLEKEVVEETLPFWFEVLVIGEID